MTFNQTATATNTMALFLLFLYSNEPYTETAAKKPE
jgi:hypothetical protein